jgi:Bacterial regulatory protein, Fis family
MHELSLPKFKALSRRSAKMKQLNVHEMIQAINTHKTMDEATRFLGVSRRTLYYKLEQATKMELMEAYQQLFNDQYEGRIRFERDYAAMEERNGRLEAENRLLRERIELEEKLKRILQREHPTNGDDPYAVLSVRRDAPPEVIEAAWKALARKYHSDLTGGDDERMKQINAAHDDILRRNAA